MAAKTKEYKKPMMAVALFALLLIGYFTRNKWIPLFTSGKVTPSSGTEGNKPTTKSTSTTLDKDRLLKKGDQGKEVKELQIILNEKHKANPHQILPLLETDGIFGAKTETMLEKWTGKKSLSITQLIIELAKA